MSKLPASSGTNGEVFKPSLEQLDKALLDAFDLMQRVVLDTTFVVLGDGARCLYENRGLDCGSLEFGIERRYVTPEVISTLKTWTTPDIKDEGFSYEFEGVPVNFKFINRKYDYFKYADQRFYGPETYRIPNPFVKYYKVRHLIK